MPLSKLLCKKWEFNLGQEAQKEKVLFFQLFFGPKCLEKVELTMANSAVFKSTFVAFLQQTQLTIVCRLSGNCWALN